IGILWVILCLKNKKKNVLKKHLIFVPYLEIFEGIVTAWIPGFMILTELW
ncbi:MAG: acid-activated urea channel, partial [Romboutsia sp.]|nr:acid-activated urea channel [Romboutsia sp.]